MLSAELCPEFGSLHHCGEEKAPPGEQGRDGSAEVITGKSMCVFVGKGKAEQSALQGKLILHP